MDESARLSEALRRFGAVHEEDPKGYASHYHARLSHWIRQLEPAPSAPLELAGHCQHLRRWAIPRTDFPEGRTGYKRWRTALAQRHAEEASEILAEVGFEPETIDRVRALLLKQRMKHDAEVQLLEDAVCLVFLENEFESFSKKHDREKLVDIVQKTWGKMSEKGHAHALELLPALPEDAQALLREALS